MLKQPLLLSSGVAKLHNAPMARVWVGTSGFSYKEWKGDFYPSDLSDRDMLAYYATRFRSVEIDSTFYRVPSAKTLEAWRETTPEDFRFALKATQRITHHERLKVPSETLVHWINIVPTLGARLGLLLYQLPPFFKCDVPRLSDFLEALPEGLPAGFEFRHPSWFSPEVYDLLERHRAILCINDGDEGCTPLETTARATYVRLRRSGYTPALREEWRARWRNWAEAGIEVFAFIKHKDNPDAPRIALEFAEGF
jgi:uncharacterized protein YecE (DUF72 family)